MTVAPGTCGGSTAAHGTTVRRGGWAPVGCGDYSPIVSLSRRCSRTACGGSAIATLTYVYSDQTAVLGPLATYAEPHTYDLCAAHAERLTAPRGWDVVRLAGEFVDPGPTQDDLLALADAVREAGRPRPGQRPSAGAGAESRTVEVGRRGHLRILRDS
jgi:Protein of unknown function (DUF3499)